MGATAVNLFWCGIERRQAEARAHERRREEGPEVLIAEHG
jgi:hypothetical protein